MNQNKEYEDMPVKEKKKKQELREAGMDVNGEFSMDSLKKWFRRAGGALSICAAAVCLMAVLMMGKNRKESLIMEVNSDIMMEFTMNRRGSVLSAKGMMARSNEAVSMTVFEGKALESQWGRFLTGLRITTVSERMGNPDLRPEVRRGSKGVTGKDRKRAAKADGIRASEKGVQGDGLCV